MSKIIAAAIIGVAALITGLYVYTKRKVETPPVQMQMKMEESIQAVEIATLPPSRDLNAW